MVDSIPERPEKCPPSDRNAVRHDAGTLSGIKSESCPAWAGIRSHDPQTGLIAMPLPPGTHRIDALWNHGPDRTHGIAITIGVFVILLAAPCMRLVRRSRCGVLR